MSENPKRYRSAQAHPPSERRRVGTVVHDERGNASVEWRDAPADQERPVLEVIGENGLSVKTDEVSYDPYARHRPLRTGPGKRTDLRKLSEWIKTMRELEERKRNGGDPEGE
ncbi:MAG TPA: hypothetical protein VL176_06965 [Steroidobacteraceae bacterium]|nr:hypothetical protein [Steroidobacteraceae bacterium]